MVVCARLSYRTIIAAKSLARGNSRVTCSSLRLLSFAAVKFDADPDPPLVRLEKAQVGYDDDHRLLPPIDLVVHSPARHGGHALLGRNGTGKSLIAQSIMRNEVDGGLLINPKSIQHVSFESHLDLLQAGGTVYQALAQGNLNKAAQFLVVRFGLYPLLHQDVRTLSNGQIKKVLIVKALSMRPRLLILDNAFDGLDVPSRQVLKELVSKTLQGFKKDKILIQAVSAKNTAQTQVLLITHRAEEIVDEITTVSYFDVNQRLVTTKRGQKFPKDLLNLALQTVQNKGASPPLPSVNALKQWWHQDRPIASSLPYLAVDMQNVSVEKSQKLLLRDLNWRVELGQRWLVGGYNGAGKSTLSRLLAQKEDEGVVKGHVSVLGADHGTSHVGWVSTELHVSLARQSNKSVRQVLLSPTLGVDADASSSMDSAISNSARTVAEWLQLDQLLDRPFKEISQGEQRLVLIAAALASRPQLLVLDEPCQGLDLLNRERVLSLVECICRATDIGLIYITHHLEELLPSVTHVLHLTDGVTVFNGPVTEYNPEEL